MKQSTVIGILAFIVIAVLVFVFASNSVSTGNYAKVESATTGQTVANLPSGEEYIVEITSSGFFPKELTINKGDTVTWVNKDDKGRWPASAMHPTHTVYPGSDIEKCGTSEEEGIFDACRGIPSGESYSFTFNEVGTWGYHDHIVNGMYGKIIVSE